MANREYRPQPRKRSNDGRTMESHLDSAYSDYNTHDYELHSPLPGSSKELPRQSPILWQPSNANRARVFTRRHVPKLLIFVLVLLVIGIGVVYFILRSKGIITVNL